MKSSAFAPIRATTKALLAVAVRCETADLRDTMVLGVYARIATTEAGDQWCPSEGQNSKTRYFNH
jgi:hypothetical protein